MFVTYGTCSNARHRCGGATCGLYDCSEYGPSNVTSARRSPFYDAAHCNLWHILPFRKLSVGLGGSVSSQGSLRKCRGVRVDGRAARCVSAVIVCFAGRTVRSASAGGFRLVAKLSKMVLIYFVLFSLPFFCTGCASSLRHVAFWL